MKYALAIFDLDGTILSTLDDLADSCNQILAQNNFPLHTKDEICTFVGNGIPKLIERALPAGIPEQTRHQITKDFITYYREHSAIKTAPYPGIPELLRDLKNAGVHIAVNTNKHEQTAAELCQKYFPGLIDTVAGGKPDTPHKPDPTGVDRILSKENCPKEKAVYIGDSDVDIMTAANAGIAHVGAAWGFRGEQFLKEHGAKNIAHSAEELKHFL